MLLKMSNLHKVRELSDDEDFAREKSGCSLRGLKNRRKGKLLFREGDPSEPM